MPRPLLCLLVPLALFAIGCGSEPPAAASTPTPPTPSSDKPADFQPSACGQINGLVTWDREKAIPSVQPVIDLRPRPDGKGSDLRVLVHPYAPRIDPFTYALAGAVVYLRGVNPTRAKPWDLPPVSVEIRDSQILVKQVAVKKGDDPQNGIKPDLRVTGRVGFVRRGEPVKFQSAEPVFHSLRGRGAAFFAIPFPDPERPLERSFDTYGRVELTSAAGFSWHAADLFVCDHPYYAISDLEGRFQFTQVPEGIYELVAWHPNWGTTASERNPETGLVQRLVYAPPLESSRPVMVNPGRKTFANANLPHPDFPK